MTGPNLDTFCSPFSKRREMVSVQHNVDKSFLAPANLPDTQSILHLKQGKTRSLHENVKYVGSPIRSTSQVDENFGLASHLI
jgi:hypothetical protein